MKITERQIRKIIREELLREETEDLNNFDVKVSGTNNITVTNKLTGKSGTSKKIEVKSSKWLSKLSIRNIGMLLYTPSAPADSPVLTVSANIINPMPFSDDIPVDAELKNRAAIIGIANAIINGTKFIAPPAVIKDGTTAQLIINDMSK
jgi:hypothetical protein